MGKLEIGVPFGSRAKIMQRRGAKYHYWQNRFAEHPVFATELDLESAAGWRGETLPQELAAVLERAFPGIGSALPGLGAAELVARLALAFQRTRDPVPTVCGVARGSDPARVLVYFACLDQHLGSAVSQLAFALVDGLTSDWRPIPKKLAAGLADAVRQIEAASLDQSTRALAAAAAKRGIPWLRIGGSRTLQLGHGHAQRHVFETLRTGESAIGVEISRSKQLTLEMLANACLPVGGFGQLTSVESALAIAERIGYPVVLKPVVGKKGDSVFVRLQNPAELRAALAQVPHQSRAFLLQRFFPGDDHRMLVVAGRLIAVARRHPAAVAGDGERSVRQLVELANRDPRRGHGR